MSIQPLALYSVGVLDQTFDFVWGILPALFLAFHAGGSKHPSCSSMSKFLLHGVPPVRCQQNNHKLTVVRNGTGAAIDQQS